MKSNVIGLSPVAFFGGGSPATTQSPGGAVSKDRMTLQDWLNFGLNIGKMGVDVYKTSKGQPTGDNGGYGSFGGQGSPENPIGIDPVDVKPPGLNLGVGMTHSLSKNSLLLAGAGLLAVLFLNKKL